MCTKIRLVIAAIILAATTHSKAAIYILISDNGTNLTMVATGTYDLTNAVVNGSTGGLGAKAYVIPNIIYGWETNSATRYTAIFSGTLTGTGIADADGLADTNSVSLPFFFHQSLNVVSFKDGVAVSGSINNSSTFNGITLASLGMVAGESVTGSWGLGGADETFSITTVPELSSCFLGALGLLLFLRRKR